MAELTSDAIFLLDEEGSSDFLEKSSNLDFFLRVVRTVPPENEMP